MILYRDGGHMILPRYRDWGHLIPPRYSLCSGTGVTWSDGFTKVLELSSGKMPLHRYWGWCFVCWTMGESEGTSWWLERGG